MSDIKTYISDIELHDPVTKEVIAKQYPRTVPKAIIGFVNTVKSLVINVFKTDILTKVSVDVPVNAEYISIDPVSKAVLVSVIGDSADTVCDGTYYDSADDKYKAHLLNGPVSAAGHTITCIFTMYE